MTKILLVEDDKSLREIYGVRLLAEGYDIVSAGDGEEALAMAIKERPQLIVSDVMMPKISGFDMLDILRSTTETKSIKVIMMTALSSEDQRLRGEQLGADRYLVKSQVGIEDVVRTVHDVLGDLPRSGNPVAMPSAAGAPTFSQPARPASQPLTPTPRPTAPPVTTPATPVAASSALPQPTAPFSGARPANLGDRIIHPLQREEPEGPNIADQISQELANHDMPPAPEPPVMPSPQIQIPVTDPVMPTSSPVTPMPAPSMAAPATQQPNPGLSFEETPLAPPTAAQPTPAAPPTQPQPPQV